jgi:hypothetical protein
VSTVRSNLVALITEGPELSILSGQIIRLDASQSFDPDLPDPTISTNDWKYEWSCAMVEPSFSSKLCGVKLVDKSKSKVTIKFRNGGNNPSANTISVISMSVTDGQRVSQTSVRIKAISNGSPVIKLSSTYTSKRDQYQKINPAERLLVLGTAQHKFPGSCTWSVYPDLEMNLANSLLTPQTIL